MTGKLILLVVYVRVWHCLCISTGLITHHTHARPHHTIYFPQKQLILAGFGGFLLILMDNMWERPPKITMKYSWASLEFPLQLPSLLESDPTSTRSNKKSNNRRKWPKIDHIPPWIPVPMARSTYPWRVRVRVQPKRAAGVSLHFTKINIKGSVTFTHRSLCTPTQRCTHWLSPAKAYPTIQAVHIPDNWAIAIASGHNGDFATVQK